MLIYIALHIGYMPSIFYMERNGNKYAYQSTSRHVPGRKNPVTDKVYLGKVDPETGEIIPKESRSRPAEEYAKHYGSVAVLDAIQKRLGILDDLKDCIPERAENIMGAAMSQVISATSFDDIHYVVDGSIIRERLKLRGSLSPAVMSETSGKVGTSMAEMDDFFRARVSRSYDPMHILDVTSVSSYSNMKGWAEWGYNRDGETLKQTNIAMVTDPRGIPLAVTMLPGSISDSSILDSTIEYLGGIGCNGRFVMDKGFETAFNVKRLMDGRMEFTVAANARSEAIKRLISSSVTDMKDASSFRTHEGHSYKVAEYEIGITETDDGCKYVTDRRLAHDDLKGNGEFEGSDKLAAFVVFSGKKASEDMDRIMDMVRDAEMRLNGRRPNDPHSRFSALPKAVKRLLGYSVDRDGVIHVHRKQNAFAFADNRAGTFVMLASKGTTWDEMMSSYDVRDWVEKAFDVYKNDIDGGRSRTGDPDSARGRMFIKFVALIMRMYIRNALRDHDGLVLSGKAKKDSVNGKTAEDVMLTLNTLMAVGNTGDWRLTAVSKGVREIFRLFGLEEPKGGRILLA
jgi:hypothetical protein